MLYVLPCCHAALTVQGWIKWCSELHGYIYNDVFVLFLVIYTCPLTSVYFSISTSSLQFSIYISVYACCQVCLYGDQSGPSDQRLGLQTYLRRKSGNEEERGTEHWAGQRKKEITSKTFSRHGRKIRSSSPALIISKDAQGASVRFKSKWRFCSRPLRIDTKRFYKEEAMNRGVEGGGLRD